MNADYAGGHEIVARFLDPTDAYLLCSCLKYELTKQRLDPSA